MILPRLNPYLDYRVILANSVRKFIKKLNKKERRTLISDIEKLSCAHAAVLDVKKLKNYKNLYRLRCGSYRVVFRPYKQEKILLVIVVAHRKEVYVLIKNISALF